jgi:NAD(P)-dependent dehydrogenase (short-subunit alcohol dehydrogenase family)
MSKVARVAVVTGAARGIGLATARRFIEAGYAVAILDIDAPEVERAAAGLQGRVLPIACDVADIGHVRAAAAKVEAELGRVVALVNNAGVAIFKPILETTLEEWRRVLAVNLDAPFICTQVFAPALLRGGGAVVNVASISGVRASALRVAYDTLMAKQVHSASIRADYHDAIPLNRYGEEREIAEAVFFLCSDAASYVNGQTLAVDGGFDASGIGLKDLRQRT